MAATLDLISPAAPVAVDPSPVLGDGTVPAAHLAAVARSGVRILAAVGPLPLPSLSAAVARGRRFRHRKPLSDSDLAAALIAVGCTVDDDGRWHPPAGSGPTDRNRVIVTLATGRELTRREMIDVLIAAGYRSSSATERMSSSHPWFESTGPDRYRLITAEPAGPRLDEIVVLPGSVGG